MLIFPEVGNMKLQSQNARAYQSQNYIGCEHMQCVRYVSLQNENGFLRMLIFPEVGNLKFQIFPRKKCVSVYGKHLKKTLIFKNFPLRGIYFFYLLRARGGAARAHSANYVEGMCSPGHCASNAIL